MIEERRGAPRVKCDFTLEIAHQKSRITTRAINISSSGMYLQSNRPIPLFREIGIGIKLPGIGKLIECTGVVVRSEKVPGKGRYNLAIFFEDIQPEDKKQLSEYVEKGLTS